MFPLVLLAVAGFTVVTTEFVIIGFLPSVAQDLQVSVSQAGLLVTLFAFTVATVGPFLTMFAARMNRRAVFVLVLLTFALANALAAVASNFEVMAVARLVPALALPVFWALASATAMELAKPGQKGRAVALINLGLVSATVLGVPLGTLLADFLGWRSVFVSLAGLSLLKAGLLYWLFPKLAHVPANSSFADQLKIIRNGWFVSNLLLSVLIFTSIFTAYTYLADILQREGGFTGSQVGFTLLAFGAIGIVGNRVGGITSDWHPLKATAIFGLITACCMLAVIPSLVSWEILAVALGLWGLSQAALFVVCHVRLLSAAPQGATALAASLNVSAVNTGIGLGALSGGLIVDQLGVQFVGAGGGLISLAAILVCLAMFAREYRHNKQSSSLLQPE